MAESPRTANQPARPPGGNEGECTRASASGRRNPAGSQWLPREARAARAHAQRCFEPRAGSRGWPRPSLPERGTAGAHAQRCPGLSRAAAPLRWPASSPWCHRPCPAPSADGSSAPWFGSDLPRGRVRLLSFFTHRPRFSLLQLCFGQTNNRSFAISKKTQNALLLNRLLQPLREGPWGFLPFSSKDLGFDAHW